MKTIGNTLILEPGDVEKPEYRAAARAALEARKGVSIPSIGLAISLVNDTTVRLVNTAAGTDKTVSGVTAESVMDKVAAYKTVDRILAVLN